MRSGFSFAEVLFAVAVLGIGFIMVAAIFPVAIMQTQATMEETIGTAVTRNGVSYMRGGPMMNSTKLPYTNQNDTQPDPAAPAPPNPGQVFSFFDPRIDINTPPNNLVPPSTIKKATPLELWNSIKANLIDTTDPRFAFVPVYVRDGGSNFAKVIVIGVRIRTRDEFRSIIPTGSPDIADTERRGPDVCADLEPRPVKVTLVDGSATNTPDRAIIETLDVGPQKLKDLSAQSNAIEATVNGAYLIISNDGKLDLVPPAPNGTAFQNEHGKLNGRVYRLGPETNIPATPAGAKQHELAIGGDLTGPGENVTDAIAFIVGRGYAAGTGTEYSGSSMAVQHYENVIPLP